MSASQSRHHLRFKHLYSFPDTFHLEHTPTGTYRIDMESMGTFVQRDDGTELVGTWREVALVP